MIQDRTSRKFFSFVVVGLINTVFGYTVYALLLWLGVPPQPALIIAFSIGVIWNYMTTARLVFRASGFRQLPPYLGAYAFIYVANAMSLQAALNRESNPFVSQAVLTPVFAILSFVLLSWVFREKA